MFTTVQSNLFSRQSQPRVGWRNTSLKQHSLMFKAPYSTDSFKFSGSSSPTSLNKAVAEHDPDDWTQESNAVKRKQIQNKLAQRRFRLKKEQRQKDARNTLQGEKKVKSEDASGYHSENAQENAQGSAYDLDLSAGPNFMDDLFNLPGGIITGADYPGFQDDFNHQQLMRLYTLGSDSHGMNPAFDVSDLVPGFGLPTIYEEDDASERIDLLPGKAPRLNPFSNAGFMAGFGVLPQEAEAQGRDNTGDNAEKGFSHKAMLMHFAKKKQLHPLASKDDHVGLLHVLLHFKAKPDLISDYLDAVEKHYGLPASK